MSKRVQTTVVLVYAIVAVVVFGHASLASDKACAWSVDATERAMCKTARAGSSALVWPLYLSVVLWEKK